MKAIELLDDLLCSYGLRLILESDGNGGITIEFVDVGGKTHQQLWVDFCSPGENLETALIRAIEEMGIVSL